MQILARLDVIPDCDLPPAELRKRLGCVAPQRRALAATVDLLPTDADRASTDLCRLSAELGLTPLTSSRVSGDIPAGVSEFELFRRERRW